MIERRNLSERTKKLLWFALLWCAGVAALGVVAFVIRAFMGM
ncbi:MAG: DUF2474 domain-containing protein [Rhodospirillales bacterium]|nr:DUF2474 domain-containing protein [Rhodospirillales bacterium]